MAGRHEEPSKVKYALGLAAYRQEQARLKSIVQSTLAEYTKPTLSLEQLRNRLEARLGSRSLSQVILEMRSEGY